MARPKAFDEDRAVEKAMRAFWTAGYEATSTQDLCAATGLGRSSIYNTFASKRDLFDKALRRYMAVKDAATAELLDGPLPVREKIRAMFDQVIDADPAEPLGCFVVNSLVELAPRDRRTANLLRRNQEKRFQLVRAALAEAHRAGELRGDPDELAHFVLATISALQVSARGGAEAAVLRAVANAALSVF
jgi:TetR/AcrR family transcriptional regulator, transcriptional repressor for nem operon